MRMLAHRRCRTARLLAFALLAASLPARVLSSPLIGNTASPPPQVQALQRGTPPASCGLSQAFADAFASAALAARGTHRPAFFRPWSPAADCQEPGALRFGIGCSSSNPSSSYFFVSPTDTPTSPSAAASPAASAALSAGFPLAPSEVLVVLACQPPPARYLGWTPYLMTQMRRGCVSS